MAETASSSAPAAESRPRRLQFRRVLDIILRPRATLGGVSALDRSLAFTPMLLLLSLLLLRVIVIAPIKAAQAEGGALSGPAFQYYTPEQQAQIQQALEATRGPTFQYVLPIGWALLTGVTLWTLTAGLLYLISTMQGGRGSMTRALNLVAWASVPTLIHLIVQVVSIQSTGKLIANPGLSGFAAPPPEGSLVARAVLSRIDLYLFWHALLLLIGLKPFTGLSARKTWITVIASLTIVMGVRILPDVLVAQLAGLTIIQPFLF